MEIAICVDPSEPTAVSLGQVSKLGWARLIMITLGQARQGSVYYDEARLVQIA